MEVRTLVDVISRTAGAVVMVAPLRLLRVAHPNRAWTTAAF
jgi:hypothetical protein